MERENFDMSDLWISPEDKGHRVVRFPERPRIWIDRLPLEDFCRRYEAGDEGVRQRVETALAQAEKWAARPDAWYLEVIWNKEPRGYRTNACPIHPYLVRYYNYFEWSLDDPWRLYCPYCREEGRPYDYYPNPRYPDDGDGCFPTDEVWREDHDEAWSRAHDGIPWDHWDGEVHGEMEPTNAYYFRGLCWLNAYLALSRNVLHSLGEGHHFASELRSDANAAVRYAQKARMIFVTLSRAFLGDPYLAAILGIPEAEFLERLSGFYELETNPGGYPGYRLFTPTDHMVGDPKRPVSAPDGRYGGKMATLWPGIWSWKAGQASALMTAYCLIAETFTDVERGYGLQDAALRIVTSVEGDAERIKNTDQKLKRGVVEYTLHPYSLVTGADNLSTSTQMPRLALGRMVGDDGVIESVAQDMVYFLHNFFTGDGMGKEGSPSYSSWGITSVMAACYGQQGDFDRTAPYFDQGTGGLNLFTMPVLKHAMGNYLYTGFPDGRPIPWEDCVIRASMPLAQFAQVEEMGGGIPEAYRPYLHITRGSDGKPAVSLNLMALPSRVLGENRKGVLRSGTGENARALSVDFTERVGHYHMAPLNLTLFAKGHELATDLGYMGSDHFMTVNWIRTFPAHNTVAIRDEDGDPMGTDHLRGDVRYFVDLPGVKAMDAAEEDASELASVPGTDRYQRTVAMIDVDGDDAYVADVFRLSGGRLHDWTFHSNGHRFETSGIALTERADAEESLYDYSGFTFTPRLRKRSSVSPWGSQRVHALRAGKGGGVWTATWGDVTEFPKKGESPMVDHEVFLKLHMLDEPGSEVIAGTAPAQRWLDNRDLGEDMTVVTVRRENRDALDTFAAVYEPYRRETFIDGVERLVVSPLDPEGMGMAVTHRCGTDVILSAKADGVVREVERDGYVLRSDGELVTARFDADGLASLSIIGGTFAEADGRRVKAAPTVEGMLAGFDDVGKTLSVRSEGGFALGDALKGEVVTVRHRERTSAYTIRSVEKRPDGTYDLHLDGWPHLAIGYLRVVGVAHDRVWVEPPPVLQGKTSHQNLFLVADDRSLAFLQPLEGRGADDILDERGTRMRSRHYFELEDTSGIAEGGEIAISPLRPGVDRVRIFGVGHWAR